MQGHMAKEVRGGEMGTEIQFCTLAHFPASVNLMNLRKAIWVDEGALQDQECKQAQRWLLLHRLLRLLF